MLQLLQQIVCAQNTAAPGETTLLMMDTYGEPTMTGSAYNTIAFLIRFKDCIPIASPASKFSNN